MSNKKYQRQVNDEIVEFEGKVYCVKTPWEVIANGKRLWRRLLRRARNRWMESSKWRHIEDAAFL
jgi:hypothetical protein